jgi:hypothetical protein
MQEASEISICVFIFAIEAHEGAVRRKYSNRQHEACDSIWKTEPIGIAIN